MRARGETVVSQYLRHEGGQLDGEVLVEREAAVDDVLVELVGEQQALLLRLGARQAAEVQPVLVRQLHGARRVGPAAPGVEVQERLLPLGDHVAQLSGNK